MMNQRIHTTLLLTLFSSILIAVLGCGESKTPGTIDEGTVDVIDEEPSSVATAGIRGLLVDQATKQTLRNTRVQLVENQGEIREDLTTPAGVFEFANLPAGEKFTIVVELDEYEKYEVVIDPILAGETETITVNLVPILKMDELPPGDGLSVGSTAPDFNLADGNGKRHSLADYAGEQRVVLLLDRGAW
jgi:hypothetical protein